MKTKLTLALIKRAALLVLLSTLNPQLSTWAQDTAFTYQGRLTDNGSPANGNYDLQFYLRDALMAGIPVGTTNTLAPVAVSNGLFTVVLDFGAGIFTGPARWLEIGVRTNGSPGSYSTLSPRQPVTPSPYAITAENLVSGGLAGPYTNAVGLNNPANSFTGNGGGLTNVSAANLGGLSASSFWKLAGNAATTPGVNFLGTTDAQAVELKVNGARALRLEPNLTSPNIIGGFSGNSIAAGKTGVTISGGGSGFGVNSANADYATVSGGLGNTAGASSATISGGAQNTASQAYGSVGGGYQNTNSGYAAAIGGGYGNAADSFYSTVSGGYQNIGSADYGVIGGGYVNTIQPNATASTIGGGWYNTIQTNAGDSTIGGGIGNTIQIYAGFSTIGGGDGNTIQIYAGFSTIGGGDGNTIQTNAFESTIGGGFYNTIQTNAYESTISGGIYNTIQPNPTCA
jgi:hypothetical protein